MTLLLLLGLNRTRMIQLSAAVGRGSATDAEKAELKQLLKMKPELKRDSQIIIDEAKETEDHIHFELCLKMLFGQPSNEELRDFLTTCRRDRDRWKEYCRLRYVFERVSKARKQFEQLSEKERQLDPKAAEEIWQRFQETKDTGFRTRKTS